MAQQSWVNQLGTVATVQNLKKKEKKKKKIKWLDKVAQQNDTVDVYSTKTLDVQWYI